MGTKIYCEKCKINFVVYHTELETLKTWPDIYSEFGSEWEERLYSCPRCDEVIITTRYNE